MKKHFRLFMAVTVIAATFILIPARAADMQYELLKEIPIGGEGGWDYLSVDEAGRRLYVSHATKVVVIDIDKNAIVGEITNTPGIHGVALAPKLNRGFTSNGREGKAGIVDLKTLQTLSRVDTQQNPDGMLFEPEQAEVYMFNGRSQSVTIFSAKSGEVLTNLPLEGKPEFPQADAKAGRVFDNLEDKSEV
ncbi:MAG TPA: YncE family protein, partial [Verrucomicrobiae bacterium]|nr:YncE family protein [Verrucomicrobiae bacterium]